VVDLEPREVIFPPDLRVPGDLSSAAFLIAAALLGVVDAIRIRRVGINPTRTGFLDAVREMGASVTLENESLEGGEPVADIVARASTLHGIDVGGPLIPRLIDEVPILAVLAARAEGRTRIRDARELRVKESDRLRVMARNLEAIGVSVQELEDGLNIEGTTGGLSGRVETALDHRIAMSFGVLAAERGNSITLDHPDVVRISYPEFWSVLMDAAQTS